MYTYATDEVFGLIVGAYSSPYRGEEDDEKCVLSIEASDAKAHARGVCHVCILVTDQRTPRPTPLTRKRMADSNNQLQSAEYYFALVSPSMLIRGVFTAIKWLTRQRQGHELSAFSTFAEAAFWVRRSTGRQYETLEQLYARLPRPELTPFSEGA